MIAENIRQVRERIREACRMAGRDPGEVTLIAVTKTMPCEALMEAYAAGERIFGENRVQEILEKQPKLPSDVRWHMIGHLQRNKVKDVIDRAEMIHSVDSLRLAQEIETQAQKADLIAKILLEVNVAGEASKFGLKAEEVAPVCEELSCLPHIRVCGLMTVAPYTPIPEENREVFRKLKKLSVDIRLKNINNINMNVLSMGMTNDYEIAIQEGATMIRVGTGIFGERI